MKLILLVNSAYSASRTGRRPSRERLSCRRRRHITLPATWPAWRAVEAEGKEVGRGTATEKTLARKAPIGYFEIRAVEGREESRRRACKNDPVKTRRSRSTPRCRGSIRAPRKYHDACTLCRLAGVKWVRRPIELAGNRNGSRNLGGRHPV